MLLKIRFLILAVGDLFRLLVLNCSLAPFWVNTYSLNHLNIYGAMKYYQPPRPRKALDQDGFRKDKNRQAKLI